MKYNKWLQHDKKYIKVIMGTFINPFNRVLKSLNRFKLRENYNAN